MNDRWEPTQVRWYVVVNDLIGGWAVSHVDMPLSQQDFKKGEGDIADFCTEAVARHIADLHNAWIDDHEELMVMNEDERFMPTLRPDMKAFEPLLDVVSCECCEDTVSRNVAHLHPIHAFYVCPDCYDALTAPPVKMVSVRSDDLQSVLDVLIDNGMVEREDEPIVERLHGALLRALES